MANLFAVLRCVITTIGVLLPACTAKSLNSPIIFNYSTYGEISNPAVIHIPVARPSAPENPWRRKEENWQEEIDAPTTTSADYSDANNGSLEDEQQRTLSNSSCLAGISCDEFFLMAPPPDVIALVPPPPLPLFLFELELSQKRELSYANWELQAKKFNFRSYYVLQREDNEGDAAIVFRINPQWLSASHSGECLLCDWAKNESTHPLFTAMKSSQVAVSKVDNWNVAVMGVALISATIGACVTCILIKLRRIKRMKSKQHKGKELPQTEMSGEQDSIKNKSVSNSLRHKAQQHLEKKWAGDKEPVTESSPNQLSSLSNQKFDDMVSEELYINANAPSVTSSDGTLDHDQAVSEDPTTFPSVSTTVSDISTSTFHTCDPLCQTALKGAYNKRGHILFENSYNVHQCGPCCSGSSPSGGSSSTPSSAYYSDVSICEVRPSRKKKKKRKVDLVLVKDRLGNFIGEPASAPTVQSSSLGIPFPSVRGPFLTNCVQSLQETPSTLNCLHSVSPCGVQYLPRFMMLKPENLPRNNIAHFHCLPNLETKPVIVKPCCGNLSYSPVKNSIPVASNENMIVKSPQLHSVGPSLNSYSRDSCIRGNCDQINEVNQEALDKRSFLPSRLCHQQVEDACKLDYEIYKEYSSSEVPSEYI